MSTPYGEWPSPIAPADVAAGGRDFAGVRIDGEHAYWLERRPAEGGRGVLRRAPLDRAREGGAQEGGEAQEGGGEKEGGGEPSRGAEPSVHEDLTPEGFDVRTLVHQYGGGDFAVADGTLVAVNMDDQRLYRLPADGSTAPTPITPDPPEPLALRYADVTVDPDAGVAYAVRERHVGPGTDDEPENEVVRIPLFPAEDDEGGDAGPVPDPAVIAAGCNFYAAPRPSPDGDRLAYLRWDHPNMPWDGTELVVVDLDGDGGPVGGSRRVVAGSPEESVCSPAWSPEGVLHAVADRTGWWNLYRIEADADTTVADGDGSRLRNLHPVDAEFGAPMWQLGLSTYAFLDEGRIATLYTADGEPSLRLLDPATGDLEDPSLPYSSFRPASIRSDGERVAFVGHRPDAPSAVVAWTPGDEGDGPNPSSTAGDDLKPSRSDRDDPRHLRESTDDPIDPAYVSTPEPIVFPTGDAVGADGTVAYAHYYPPHNPDASPPGDPARPPLVVTVHGGPTSRSEVSLSASTQFFTTRGIAVLDVNYRGSTGYGRAYRDALDGQWGVRDTLDCVNAARHAVAEGLADPGRLAISGGSAGGYAVLCALAFHDTFDAGASYYGVADLAALSAETHKFESRYLDGLVGPLPGSEATYRERSPLYHAEGISAPLLLLQGGEDEVVPPAQAEAMIDALVAGGTPYAYVEFPEERHGFRDADNIARAHAAELAFYREALGFEPDDDVDGVHLLVGEYPPEFD